MAQGRGDTFTRRAALTGVIVSDAVLSYSILHARAEHIGFSSWATWLYPIGLDALIVGSSRTWQNADLSDGTRRLAKWITLASVTFGMAGFIAEFYPRGWWAVLFALFVPASLAAALILTSRAAADRKANDAGKRDQPGSDDASRPSEPVTHDASIGVDPERTPIETALGVAPNGETFRGYADRLVDELQGRDAPLPDDVVQLDNERPLWTNAEPVTFGPFSETRTVDIGLLPIIPGTDGPDPVSVTFVPEDELDNTESGYARTSVTFPADRSVPASAPREGGVSVSVNEPTEKPRKKPDGQGASADEKRAWIAEQLDAGKNVTGADVDRQFPGGSRNGARLVRSVQTERAARS